MAKIYKITNDVNNFVYVGFTSSSIEQRWRFHVRDHKDVSDTRPLYVAMRDIGIEHFSISVIDAHDDDEYCLRVLEPHYIKENNSFENGYNASKGGDGSTRESCRGKKVFAYDDELNYVRTFNSNVEAAEFLESDCGTVSAACSNASKGESSYVKGLHLAREGVMPVLRKWNNQPGIDAAKLANTGKKRPEHSSLMKSNARQINNLYVIPEGEFILADASEYYGQDMLMEWCKNCDKVITKMSIIKSKALSIETHSSWIGKTRREVGFYFKVRN